MNIIKLTIAYIRYFTILRDDNSDYFEMRAIDSEYSKIHTTSLLGNQYKAALDDLISKTIDHIVFTKLDK